MEAQYSNTDPNSETGSRIGVRFYRYRAIVKRYWWVLLLCLSVGLLYEVFVLLTKPTRSVSIGKLIVNETGTDEASHARTMEQNWGGTIVETLKSPVVRDRAAKKVAVEKPQWERLVDGVEILAVNEPNTYFFTVTGAGPNADFTRYFVDAIMEAFMQMRREESRAVVSDRIEQLGRETDRGRTDVEQTRPNLERFKEDNNVPFIEQQAEQISAELSDLRRARGELLQQVNIYKNLNEASLLEANSPKLDKKGGNQSGDSLGNRWLDKQEQLAIKEAELTERSTVWKPAHPRFQLLEKEVADLRLSIEVLKGEAAKNLEGVLRRLKAEIQTKESAITE